MSAPLLITVTYRLADFSADYLNVKPVSVLVMIMLAASVLCFVVSELTGNYSQVDKLWSILPVVYSWVTYSANPSPRLLLMAILVTAWGFRLSYNFWRKGGYNIIPWRGEEDYRWKIMRDNPVLKGRFKFGLFNLLFISLYQNFLILLFSSPLLIAAGAGERQLNLLDLAASIIIILALLVETIADNQRFRFHEEKNKGKLDGKYSTSVQKGFITEGIWKYSRHPNFVAEQTVWIGFYIFSIAASSIVINISVTGCFMLVLLFLGSSGLTEKISNSKYPGYAEYMRRVPRYLPRLFK